MSEAILTRIADVKPLENSTTGRHLGDYVPLVLECGHVARANPIFSPRVGDQWRCYKCEFGDGESGTL